MINNGNQNRSMNMQSNLAFFLVGGGIGVAVALLFAPKPGKELRQDVTEAAKYGMDTATNTASQIKDSANEYYQMAQGKASELYKTAFKTVNDGTEAARSLANDTIDKVQDTANQLSDSSLANDKKTPFEQRTPKNAIH
jgi:gas vesicle protein